MFHSLPPDFAQEGPKPDSAACPAADHAVDELLYQWEQAKIGENMVTSWKNTMALQYVEYLLCQILIIKLFHIFMSGYKQYNSIGFVITRPLQT